MKVYFAHAMPDYNTVRERLTLVHLQKWFPEAEIVNPNTAEHAAAALAFKLAGKVVMDYFCALARECDAVAFMPTEYDEIGPGVAKEIIEAACFGKQVWRADESAIVRYNPVTVNGYTVVTIDVMRERLAHPSIPVKPKYEDLPSSYGKPVWDTNPKLVPLNPVVLARAWEKGEDPTAKLSASYPPVTETNPD